LSGAKALLGGQWPADPSALQHPVPERVAASIVAAATAADPGLTTFAAASALLLLPLLLMVMVWLDSY